MRPQGLCTAIFTLGLLALDLPSAHAVVAGPYTVDADTLHLWHLDETGAPAQDSVAGGTPMQGLLNNATLGNASYTGFGTALNTNTSNGGTANQNTYKGGILFHAPALANGTADNIASPFAFTGADGAFTFEAIVRLDVVPGTASSFANMQIISMDDDTTSTRNFHFRLNDLAAPNLEFVNFNTLGNQNIGFALPTTGPHALVQGSWYHAAVTYNGLEDTAGNLSLYWTALDSGATTANLLNSGQMIRDLTGNLADFAIGNEGRDSITGEAEAWAGLVDEVRISGVARTADQFIFAVPEPSAACVVLLAGGMGLIVRRRRN